MCEKAIRKKIVEDFPDHGILGEEEVEPGIQASIDALEAKLVESDWLWIIDPVRSVGLCLGMNSHNADFSTYRPKD